MGKLGSVGLRIEDIATVIGCSRQYLHSLLNTESGLRTAYADGRSDWRARVASMIETMRKTRATAAA
jgi:hypothetical protein